MASRPSLTSSGIAPANIQHVARIPKTSELIADQIRRLILNGELGEGDSLQSTSELVRQFGVSRPTLREAFRILESENLISVSRGSRTGARVHRPSVDTAARSTGLVLQASGATLGDLYEAELAIEPFAARIVAERGDKRDLARLRAHFSELEQLAKRRDRVGMATSLPRFHHLLVELTGNKMLTLTAALITKVLERYQRQVRSIVSAAGATEFHGQGDKSIAKLLRLIEAKDGDGAETHWRSHLVNASKYWLAGQDPNQVIDVFEQG